MGELVSLPLLWARPITRRETDVLRLVVARLRNGEIATRLNISKRTVESHVAGLLRKLEVRDRSQLIAVGALMLSGTDGGGARQHGVRAEEASAVLGRAALLRANAVHRRLRSRQH